MFKLGNVGRWGVMALGVVTGACNYTPPPAQIYNACGDRISFPNGTHSVVDVHDQDGNVIERITDYNSNGNVGDVWLDTYLRISPDGRRRVITPRRVELEDGTTAFYQGPDYHASDEEQKTVLKGREFLAKNVTPRMQCYQGFFFSHVQRNIR